ncbi:MAG: methionyl-tRNA formyltransferase [Candidatus Eisenbacteria bacterium]|uniref:Methionyl-tRNA formyltransferase n=1 Tax=Eiseniibacteriota bacterium TaxID=2212470 RepID=A0A538T8H3_UNCEI|nr:MAG: methionyl-tRNA formyltransferase [Candidatus Eisenbacteria bacterium]
MRRGRDGRSERERVAFLLAGGVRLVYYGTPILAVPPLLRLIEDGKPPSLVVTRRDRPSGRGLALAPSPVRAAAEARGIPVATPERAGAPEEIERLRALAPDVLVLVAYGQILSPGLLRLPKIGAINVHFSLLPRHRGASPIQAAILAGDREAGVTTMWMTEKLDEGPVFSSLSTPIGPEEDAGSLGGRLAELGARCLSETLTRIERGEIVRRDQDPSRATYAPKLTREDSRLLLADDPVRFTRKVRAFAPEPGAYLELERERIQILSAAPGSIGAEAGPGEPPGSVLALHRERGLAIRLSSGSVWLKSVRPSGRKVMDAFAYANGARIKPGGMLPVKDLAA